MSRSMTFVVEGDVKTEFTVTENADGTLSFQVEVLGDYIGDLRGLFFDLDGLDVADGSIFVTDAADVASDGVVSGEEDVSKVAKDVNLKGSVVNELGEFDVGIEFGTQGMSRDDIQFTTFTLGSTDTALTLDMLSLSDLGIRYTSVGDVDGSRDDSLKIGDQTGGSASDDFTELQEGKMVTVDLLANDDIVGTIQDPGTVQLVDENGVVFGTVTFDANGMATVISDGPGSLALNDGESVTLSYDYTVVDGTSTATATLSITINGVSGGILDYFVEPTADVPDPVPPLVVSWTSDTGGTVDFLDEFGGVASTETFSAIDTFILGAKSDTVFGASSGEQSYDLKDGDDVFNGGAADETVVGEDGDDTIDGGAGEDVIDGGNGDDMLAGGDGRDFVSGGLGNDYVVAGVGDGILDGGEGDEIGGDTIDFSGLDLGGAGLSINLSNGVVVTAGTVDAATNFENVVGTTGDDTIVGSEDDNVMTGGDGADTFEFDLSGPGIGDNVITDFDAAEGDVLFVFGVTDPNSPDPMMPDLNYLPNFTQSGDDVVISFADPDTFDQVGSVILEDVTFDPSLFNSLILV